MSEVWRQDQVDEEVDVLIQVTPKIVQITGSDSINSRRWKEDRRAIADSSSTNR